MKIFDRKRGANIEMKRSRKKMYVRQSSQSSKRKTASIERVHLKPLVDISRLTLSVRRLEMGDHNNTGAELIPTCGGVALHPDQSGQRPTFFDILQSRVLTSRGGI